MITWTDAEIKEIKETARVLYMSGYSVAKIATLLSVSSIYNWIKSW